MLILTIIKKIVKFFLFLILLLFLPQIQEGVQYYLGNIKYEIPFELPSSRFFQTHLIFLFILIISVQSTFTMKTINCN